MSTNFYAVGPGAERLDNQSDPGLHIGKKSGGWDFLFRGHPELGLTTVASWREFLTQPDRQIVTEYGTVQKPDEFFAMATTRPADDPALRPHGGQYRIDSYRYDNKARGVPFLDREFC
ncbi:hypothetical protein [Mycolicibacterium goodii]|uniref:hypothetical protein n=1 Tax=Mycolicibacterium goodii TaxID=134601 RepID=UPI001BDD20AE|nr:hypothetical protein [Mycolicibacterium goodii]MBU8839116.1 hypothetical protein [Mycolicibacterium goodii]